MVKQIPNQNLNFRYKVRRKKLLVVNEEENLLTNKMVLMIFGFVSFHNVIYSLTGVCTKIIIISCFNIPKKNEIETIFAPWNQFRSVYVLKLWFSKAFFLWGWTMIHEIWQRLSSVKIRFCSVEICWPLRIASP